MSNSGITDIVGLFVFLAAMAFSHEVAAVIGPYLVIVIAGSVGASFALARREKSTRLSAIGFFLRVVALAVLLTVGFAACVSLWRPDFSPRLTVAPIALLVGYIGDNWPQLLGKITRVIFSTVDLLRGPKGDQ